MTHPIYSDVGYSIDMNQMKCSARKCECDGRYVLSEGKYFEKRRLLCGLHIQKHLRRSDVGIGEIPVGVELII